MIYKIKTLTLILASTCLFACNGTKTDDSSDKQLEDSLFSQENVSSNDEDYPQEEGLPDEIVGTYKTILPAGDVESELTIVLNKDGSFKKSEQLISNKDQTPTKGKGMIDWNEEDSIITLISTVDTTKLKFKILKNEIKALNLDGTEIIDNLEDQYSLIKK